MPGFMRAQRLRMLAIMHQQPISRPATGSKKSSG